MADIRKKIFGLTNNTYGVLIDKFLTLDDIVNHIRNNQDIFTTWNLSGKRKSSLPAVLWQAEGFYDANIEDFNEKQLTKLKDKHYLTYEKLIKEEPGVYYRLKKLINPDSNIYFIDFDIDKILDKYTKTEIYGDDTLIKLCETFNTKAKQFFANLEYKPFYMMESSNYGLHLLYYCDFKKYDREIIHEFIYYTINKIVDETFDYPNFTTKIDLLKDQSRLSYVKYDKNLYYEYNNEFHINENEIDKWYENKQKEIYTHDLPKTKRNNIEVTDYSSFEYSSTAVEHCHKIGLNAFIKKHKKFSTLNEFIITYTPIFLKYGVSKEDIYKTTFKYLSHIPDFTSNPNYISSLKDRINHFYDTYFNPQNVIQFIEPTFNKLIELTINNNQYLSDININLPKRCILKSPTGSGKTTMFARLILESKNNGIICFPTQDMVKKFKEDYNADVYYYDEKTVTNNSKLIATTYSSFLKVIKIIEMSEYILCVDEIHNMVLSSSQEFRSFELNVILDNILNFKQTILMSGTYLNTNHPALHQIDDNVGIDNLTENNKNKFTIVNVKYKNPKQKYYCRVKYYRDRKYQTLVNKLIKHTGKQIIFLNNKKEETISKILNNLNEYYSTNEILILNSDRKQDDDYIQFMKTGETNENIKIILTTSISIESLSFYDIDYSAVHLLEMIHPAFIQQLFARPRFKQPDILYIYIDDNYFSNQSKYTGIMYQTLDTLLVDTAIKRINDITNNINNNSDEEITNLLLNVSFINNKNNELQKFRFDNNNVKINYLGCSFLAHSRIKYQCLKNNDYLKYLLSEYNWIETTEDKISTESAENDFFINTNNIKTYKKSEFLKFFENNNISLLSLKLQSYYSNLIENIHQNNTHKYKGFFISTLRRLRTILNHSDTLMLNEIQNEYEFISKNFKVLESDKNTSRFIEQITYNKLKHYFVQTGKKPTEITTKYQFKLIQHILINFNRKGQMSKIDIIFKLIPIVKQYNVFAYYSTEEYNNRRNMLTNKLKKKNTMSNNEIQTYVNKKINQYNPSDSELWRIFKLIYKIKRTRKTINNIVEYQYQYNFFVN